MSHNIHPLSDLVIAQISAGEVVETPVNIVKELIENSLDANSSEILIFVEERGLEQIIVRDNGDGIFQDDLIIATQNFTTSKLSSVDDLLNLSTMGFRGEALGSIQSVSELTLESSRRVASSQDDAFQVTSRGGKLLGKIKRSALHEGTQVTIRDLFYNVPVRKKSLPKVATFKKKLLELLTSFGLSYPEVSFICYLEKKEICSFRLSPSLSERIQLIYSKGFFDGLEPLYYQEESHPFFDKVSIEGYISNFDFYKYTGDYIKLFINNRIVQYKKLYPLLRSIYGELLPVGRFPIAFLFLKIDPQYIDINIHPQKKEIRFVHDDAIHLFLRKAIIKSIEQKGVYQLKELTSPRKNRFTSYQKSLPNSSINSSNQTTQVDLLPSLEFLQEDSSYDLQVQNRTNEIEQENTNSLIHENLNIDKVMSLVPKIVHCTLFKTFILASSDEGVFLIDQHTAHERIQYERYLKKIKNAEVIYQSLLVPIKLYFSPSEQKVYEEYQEDLEKIGFFVEDLGPLGFVLQKVPIYVQREHEQESLFLTIKLLESKDKITNEEIFDELAKNVACRASIRKGEQESLYNLKDLVRELFSCEVPVRCPHGRPTIVCLNKADIFEVFKRFSY